MDFQHTTLDNGLNIIAEVNADAASMAAGFFVKTGSRDETAEVSGVSHFLEHMVFKGTERRTAFDVNLEFDRMGASYNAFTAVESTVFYAAVLPEFQARVLDLLGDMLRPSLREDDFDVEKNVILDEIARYEDMPTFRCYEKLMQAHFSGHPLGNSILGTPDSIRALKRDDMRAYFDRRYSPGNVTVVGVGNLRYDAFVEKVTELCKHWRPYDAPRAKPATKHQPRQVVVTDAKVAREHIGLMSPATSCQDEARHAAQVTAVIVGDATGSRLYYALVEPAIADQAHMTYDPLDEAGTFLTFLSTDTPRAGEAVRIARSEFRKFLDEGPTDAELQAAKNKIASGATLKGELPMGRLTEVGFEWVYRGQYVPLAESIEAVLRITRDEVADLARTYDLTAATVLALGPVESL